MARKPLTASQQKAKVAKMKATKAANKAKAMEAIGYVAPKKVRKKRKPMSPEQKAAAIARLAKARAARGVTGNASVHEDVLALPDDHPLNAASVKEWLKSNKAELNSIKSFKDSKESKERQQYQNLDVYVTNLATYLRTGVWLDNRWGENGEHSMGTKVLVKAYHKDGTVKRTKGFWYDDIGIYDGS
jgi:hypothetical protein